MPHYLLSIHHDDETPVGEGAEIEQIVREVDALNAALREAGAWVYAGGLQAAGRSLAIDGRTEEAKTSSGTVLAGEQQLGGLWIIDAPDEQQARHWALRASAACRFPVELRAFHEL